MAPAVSSRYEPQSLWTGVGCAFIIPAALFGTLLLIEDHLFSGGWFLVAELVGWWAICIGISAACSVLLRHSQTVGRGRYWLLLAAVGLAVVFTLMAIGEAHPRAPGWLKDTWIALLQGTGIVTLPATVAYFGWLRWRSRTN